MSVILVVDDRALNREFLATLLRYAGHRVLEAVDGADALDMVRRERPELVISDVLMPVLDGVELAHALQADPDLAGTPIIFYTATYRFDEARALTGTCGVHAVLSKPAEPQIILDAVQAALGTRIPAGARLTASHAEAPVGDAVTVDQASATSVPVQSMAILQRRVRDTLGRSHALFAAEGRLPGSPERLQQACESLQSLSLRLAAVLEVGLELANERDPLKLLRMLCGAGQMIVSARYSGICVDIASGRPWRFVARGLDDTQANAVRAALVPDSGLLGDVFATRKPARISAADSPSTVLGLPTAHPAVDSFLAVPLLTGRGASGWMYFASRLDGGDFNADDEQFALTLAAQLAPAYENLMLYDQVQHHARQLESEVDERKLAAARLGESELRFRQLAENIDEAFFLVAPGRNRLLYLSPAYKRICGHSRAPLYHTLDRWLDDVHPDDRSRAEREVKLAQPPGQFESEFRIIRPDGAVRWVRARGFPIRGPTQELERVAGVAEDITERREHEAGIARLSRIRAVLSGINSAIVRIRDRTELMQEACRIAVEEGVFELAWIGVVDPLTEQGHVAASCGGGDPADPYQTGFSVRADGPFCQHPASRALRERRPVICNELRADSAMSGASEWVRGCRSLAAFPLHIEAAPAAVLVLCATDAGSFDEQELRLLRELAGDIAFGLQYIEKEEGLNYLAFYDVLTGLANSSLFLDRLTQFLHTARPAGEGVAVIVIDLERFTQINDSLGRQAGDAVLKLVAERLNSALDEPFSVARISGDMFAIAVGGLRQRADVSVILREQVIRAVELPCLVDGSPVQVSIRAGVALYPTDGDDAATLFKNAEAALKQAQASSEPFLYYAPQMNAAVTDKLAMEMRIRRALEQQQFQLCYQPKVTLGDGRIIGFEALARWDDPEHGLISPAKFIPLLEETGLILQLGDWALRQALSDYRAWRDAGLKPPRVAVNVSAFQLHRADFADAVLAAIEASGADTAGLEIEVTESLIMRDIDAGTRSLQRLREAGVTVAVDDFGTGYSSLRYLAKLPLDSLKIDRSFVITMLEDRSSMAIVAMIISLAHAMGLRVIAEGVDAQAQASALARMGCDQMQGFLYSRPVSSDMVVKLLNGGGTHTAH